MSEPRTARRFKKDVSKRAPKRLKSEMILRHIFPEASFPAKAAIMYGFFWAIQAMLKILELPDMKFAKLLNSSARLFGVSW